MLSNGTCDHCSWVMDYDGGCFIVCGQHRAFCQQPADKGSCICVLSPLVQDLMSICRVVLLSGRSFLHIFSHIYNFMFKNVTNRTWVLRPNTMAYELGGLLQLSRGCARHFQCSSGKLTSEQRLSKKENDRDATQVLEF